VRSPCPVMMVCMVAIGLCLLLQLTFGAEKPKVILTLMVDDLGYYDTAVNNPLAPTPHVGKLADQGLRLDRHYTYWFCSPTRRSFLSGRFPAHISGGQADICSNLLPLNFTLLSEKLKRGGFASHFVGKGHLGHQTVDHLPINRGFDSHAGYLWGGESYSYGNHSILNFTKDFWHDHLPGDELVDDVYYSTNWYTERAISIIESHDFTQPLWLHLAYQAVHGPFEDTPEWEQIPYKPDFCEGAGQHKCKIYGDMLAVLDSGIGNVTGALQRKGLWNETLLLFVSDNGGTGPGNNYPLRGEKGTPWEGGTRVAAFLSGGYLPESLRGKRSSAFVHIADWYATFSTMVGVDPSDTERCEHDIDGMDVWPLLTGSLSSNPREFLPITARSIVWNSQYKLITQADATWDYTPNRTLIPASLVCTSEQPCLFDVLADPGETQNLGSERPDIVEKLQAQLASYKVYTSTRMSALELEPYACMDKPDADSTTWPWGPPSYRSMFAGPCCLRKEGALV